MASKNQARRPAEESASAASRDTMTVAELSQRLGLGINQTYRALERGEIPGRRIGGRWIVGRRAIETWLHGDPGPKAA